MDFKKFKAFRRQNSYIPQLDEFGDLDDADNLKDNLTSMRRSIDAGRKRDVFNVKVQDVVMHRLEKDIMAASVSDSMGNTGFKNSGGLGGFAGGTRKQNASQIRKQTGTMSNFNSTGGLNFPGG